MDKLIQNSQTSETNLFRLDSMALLSDASSCNIESLKSILARQDSSIVNTAHRGKGPSALIYAAANDCVEGVKILLLHGADVNAKEPLTGETALIYAAKKNNIQMAQAIFEYANTPVDVNAKMVIPGRTALDLARIHSGKNSIVPLGKDPSSKMIALLKGYGALEWFQRSMPSTPRMHPHQVQH